jgi:hypothetical protein
MKFGMYNPWIGFPHYLKIGANLGSLPFNRGRCVRFAIVCPVALRDGEAPQELGVRTSVERSEELLT